MTILHSQRGSLDLLEYAKVYVHDDVVMYTEANPDGVKRAIRSYNVPRKNISFLLLGTGTSITNDAMTLLSDAGVVVGFCSTSGTRLRAAADPVFVAPQDNFRDPSYCQRWGALQLDPERRLKAAIHWQTTRLDFTQKSWDHLEDSGANWTAGNALDLKIDDYKSKFAACKDNQSIMAAEAAFTKWAYAQAKKSFGIEFVRQRQVAVDLTDPNRLLDNGNYLAYGLAGTICWVLGLPQGMPLFHGRTTRGGLIFDIADGVKDACVLPHAFLFAEDAKKGLPSAERLSQFHRRVVDTFDKTKAMEHLFSEIEKVLSI